MNYRQAGVSTNAFSSPSRSRGRDGREARGEGAGAVDKPSPYPLPLKGEELFSFYPFIPAFLTGLM